MRKAITVFFTVAALWAGISVNISAAAGSASTLQASSVNISGVHCAIDLSGKVGCWGGITDEQRTVPSNLGSVTQVEVGAGFACALTITNRAKCWGNLDWLGNIPEDLGEAKQISAKSYQVCIITIEDKARCWGDDRTGVNDVPSDLGAVNLISTGYGWACAARISGYIRCWGQMQYIDSPYYTSDQAQLVLNPPRTPDFKYPVRITSNDSQGSCAISSLGNLKCWGWNLFGQIEVPSDLGPVREVAMGNWSICAITQTYDVRCWGDSSYGRFELPGNVTFKQISLGDKAGCGITIDQGLMCWTQDELEPVVPETLFLNVLSKTPEPVIIGEPRIGGTLNAVPGEWDEGVIIEFRWLRDGAPIANATGQNYSPTLEDMNHEIQVQTTGKLDGYVTSTQTSDSMALTTVRKPSLIDFSSFSESEIWNWNQNNNYAFGGAEIKLVQNAPALSGPNPSTALKLSGGSECWAGSQLFELPIGESAISSENRTVSANVWAPAAGLPIKMKMETNPYNPQFFLEADTTSYRRGWQKLVWDFGVQPPNVPQLSDQATYNKIFLFPNFDCGFGNVVEDHKNPWYVSQIALNGQDVGDIPAQPLTLETPVVTVGGGLGMGMWANQIITDPDMEITYQWLRNGIEISGAREYRHSIGLADLGAIIRLRVSGSKAGYETVSALSDEIFVDPVLSSSPCPAASTLPESENQLATPVLSGSLKIGQLVKARNGRWPSGYKLCSFWVLDNQVVSGAIGKLYKIRGSDLGKQLQFVVVGTDKDGTSHMSYSDTKYIPVPTFDKATTPVVKGVSRVGSRLSAYTRAWVPGVRFEYQWLRNGEPLWLGNSPKYTPNAEDQGSVLSVRVCGYKEFYEPLCLTSEGQTVSIGQMTLQGEVSISNSWLKPGSRLIGLTTPWMKGVSLTSQWFVDGEPIVGETSPEKIIQDSDRGKKLTYQITATAPGYETVVRISNPKTIPRK